MSMLHKHSKALLWGVGIALYLRFLLTPTAWLFYELHHLTGVDFIYWGYSGFRAAGYFFDIWPYQSLSCVLIGLLVFAWSAWREDRRNRTASTMGTAA